MADSSIRDLTASAGSQNRSVSHCAAVLGVLLFVFFAALTWLRFRPWMPQFLSADDLYNFMLYHGDRFNSPMSPIYFAETGQKFRFVFSYAVTAETHLFGPHPDRYFMLNVAIHALSGVMLCFLAASLSGSWIAAIILTSLAVTCRFALYQVAHLTGQVESLSLMFAMVSILAAKTSIERNWDEKWKWVALAASFFALSSHERYVVVMAWLSLFFVFHHRAGSIRRRALFALACVALVGSNVLMKIYVYKAHVMEGTANTPLAVDVGSIRDLLSQAVLSIFGINHGPQYLVGAEWMDFSTSVRFASVIFAVVVCLLVIAAFTRREQYAPDEKVRWPLAFAVLMVLLLLPPVLTIRLEQRWEVASFFMLLLIAASGIAHVRTMSAHKILLPAALGALIVCAVIIEVRVSRSFEDISFVYGDRYATAAKHAIIDSKTSRPGTPIVLISPQSVCGGTLLDGGFFVIYEGAVRPVFCVDSTDAAPRANYPAGSHLFEASPTIEITDITDNWK